MEQYLKYYYQAEKDFEILIDYINNQKGIDLQFYHLQDAVKNLLKSILSFYHVKIDTEDYIDLLIEIIEEKTTIKLPEKELLYELSFIPFENGCASNIVYEKLPADFIEIVKILKEFVENDIGKENLNFAS